MLTSLRAGPYIALTHLDKGWLGDVQVVGAICPPAPLSTGKYQSQVITQHDTGPAISLVERRGYGCLDRRLSQWRGEQLLALQQKEATDCEGYTSALTTHLAELHHALQNT